MPDFYDGGHAPNGPDGGPLVALIHGAGSNHTVWRYQTRFLANRGYRVMAFDLPGHGSNRAPGLSSVAEIAAWVGDRLPEPGAIIGHSLGGLIALELARTQPDLVERLGLLGCSTRMEVNPRLQLAADARDPSAIAMIVAWSYSGHIGRHPEPGINPTRITARLLESELTNLGPDLFATSSYEDGAEAVRVVKMPALVIAGGRDRMAPSVGVKEMSAAIDDAQFLFIADGGHFMNTDSPDTVRKSLSTFLPSP